MYAHIQLGLLITAFYCIHMCWYILSIPYARQCKNYHTIDWRLQMNCCKLYGIPYFGTYNLNIRAGKINAAAHQFDYSGFHFEFITWLCRVWFTALTLFLKWILRMHSSIVLGWLLFSWLFIVSRWISCLWTYSIDVFLTWKLFKLN